MQPQFLDNIYADAVSDALNEQCNASREVPGSSCYAFNKRGQCSQDKQPLVCACSPVGRFMPMDTPTQSLWIHGLRSVVRSRPRSCGILARQDLL